MRYSQRVALLDGDLAERVRRQERGSWPLAALELAEIAQALRHSIAAREEACDDNDD